jgi:hypothetical protein
MRRRHLALVLVVVSLTLVTGALPAEAGEFNGPTVEIVKATEGAAPTGAVYEIAMNCDESGDGETVFLEAGESQVIEFPFDDECTITEEDDQGATSVSFECEASEGVDCLSGDSFEALLNGVEQPQARVTVTNTFGDPATTTTTLATTTTTTAAAAAAAAAVVATPAFTG